MFYNEIRNNIVQKDYLINESAIDMPLESSFINDALRVVAEGEHNWNIIMKQVAFEELAYMEQTGQEMIYNEGVGGNFFNNAKEWFINLGRKVKGLFEKFLAWINSHTKDDIEFIKKYQSAIITGASNIPSSFSYKGYKYVSGHLDKLPNYLMATATSVNNIPCNASAVKSAASQNYSVTKDRVKQINDKKIDILDELRGTVIGKSASISSSEFSKELFEYFHGDKSKISLEKQDINASQLISEISNTKRLKSDAENSLREVTNSINKSISEINDMSKSISTKDETNAGAILTLSNSIIYILKEVNNINFITKGHYLAALRDRNRQAKSICVKLIGYSKKEFKESTNIGYSGLELI